MHLQTLNRFQAFTGHVIASAGVALLSAALVFLLWYPGLLAPASGVRHIFLLLLLVDVMLGPVITLIIFNPQKKELKRDLIIVVIIQMAALLYGLLTVFMARPVYMVFNVDRFDLVYANEIAKESLAKAASGPFQSLPVLNYKIVAAISPADRKERSDMLFSAISGGADLPQMPQYYVPYPEQKMAVLKRVQPLAELNEFNKDKLSVINALGKKYMADKKEVGYLPMKAKVSDLSIIIDRSTGDVLEMVDLKPWK